ncbi:MAG: iron complex transport system ATP-binding protein [Sulfurimonas sp.]|jgi:iron complex transport system ATP-binding protein
MDIINFENIHVGYDTNLVLKDINLKIKDKEHWAILGANGSGKSTLMKLIQSDIHPRRKYKFKKEILGESIYSIFDLKKKLGIITNDLHNFFYTTGSYLNAYEVVLSGYYSSVGIFKYQEFSDEQKLKALKTLKYLGIEHLCEKKVKEMSTGELRKCIVARALINEPKAFVLDEPTVGLDIKAQLNFIQMLRKLSEKSSIILVTHHLEEIFDKITHVALIHNKTIFKSGLKKDILTSENLSTTFNIDLHINEKNGRYFVDSINNQ